VVSLKSKKTSGVPSVREVFSTKFTVLDPEKNKTRFGGCQNLLQHYRTIGSALATLEDKLGVKILITDVGQQHFSIEVSFILVEVLESYLEDLLEPDVSDESLFIKKSGPAIRGIFFLALSFISLGATALSNLETKYSTLSSPWELSMLVVILFLGGIGSALYFLPRTKVVRRFVFATLLSREIAQRRGSGGGRRESLYKLLFRSEYYVGAKPAIPTIH